MLRYIAGNISASPGGDLVNDADGGVVVVEIQYRLGLFGQHDSHFNSNRVSSFISGFLAGSQIKDKGALNAGLREFLRIESSLSKSLS